ncbi:MAG: glycogen/starch synthase [Lentisphaeria bacterium]|jgi:ADP-glucose type glycogen/starch synthase
MTTLCLFLAAHQPRRLKKNPALAAPFDIQEEQQQLRAVAARSFLPVNRMLARLVERQPAFRACVSISGPLLEMARRHHPELLHSFQELAQVARDSGRIEFLAEPSHHSLASLFRDASKTAFRAQAQLHIAMLEDLLGVVPTAFRNTGLLFNNTIGHVAGEVGFKALFCERRADLAALAPAGGLLTDRLKRLLVLPRDRERSEELARHLAHNPEPGRFEEWLQRFEGDVVLGFPYECAGEIASGADEPWEQFAAALAPAGVTPVTAGELVASRERDRLPIAALGDLATSSWKGAAQDTGTWLGNRAQQILFQRYQELETPLVGAGDEPLLETWRQLGAADLYAAMSTLDVASTAPRPEKCDEISQAIAAYATVLTELRCEAKNLGRPSFQIQRKARRPRILLVTPEVTELPSGIGNLANFIHAKGGGLADISSALVAEMVKLGLDVHIALPKYEQQMCDFARIRREELDRLVSVFQGADAIHLVQDSSFAYIKDVYEARGPNSALHRAEAFQRAVINQVFDQAMPLHGKMLVHCNDWMTGLIPAAAHSRGIPSLFTIHNVHTNKDTLRNLENCGLDVSRFWRDLYLDAHPDHMPNFWDADPVDFLLSGVKAANFVNTVSPTFLLEIIHGHFPELISARFRTEMLAKHKAGCAFGILNAPKSNVDPRTTAGLKRNFDVNTVMEAKRENKLEFQKRLGLEINADAPLFFWPHRIFSQKGPHLLSEIALALVSHYWSDGLQVAIVGNGDPDGQRAFGTIACGSHGRIAYHVFEDSLSELGKAAADFILMPSLYEPCGLPQMEGMRYGTLPIVRATGGLKDTVQHLDPVNETGNGFVFNDFTSDALWWAIGEAMRFHRLPPPTRERIIRRIMREGFTNFNLEKTTLQYVRLYERLLGEKLA